MIKYTPVPLEDHAELIGNNFNERFANEMHEYYKPFIRKGRAIQLAKETWEYAIADSINDAKWVGAGKNIIDVDAPGIQIDAKALGCNHLMMSTSEASLLQNNKAKNDHFAKLFENEDFQGLKDMFVDPLFEKIKGTKNLHLLCPIRERIAKKVHYCLLKVSNEPNNNFLNEMYISGTRSISVPLIDPTYGKTVIYIPKRRLELRLKMSAIQKFCIYSHSY